MGKGEGGRGVIEHFQKPEGHFHNSVLAPNCQIKSSEGPYKVDWYFWKDIHPFWGTMKIVHRYASLLPIDYRVNWVKEKSNRCNNIPSNELTEHVRCIKQEKKYLIVG